MPNRRTAGWLTAVLVFWAVACNPGSGGGAGAAIPRPECPTHTLNFVRGRDTAPVVVDVVGLSPTISRIPEFHDCQRLLVGGDYGPMVAVIAAETLATEGALDGITQSLGLGVATVYAYDDTYDALAIGKEFNCLYFFQGPSGNDRYTARMVKWNDENCPPTMSAENGRPLRVIPSPGQYPHDQVPPVARWDWVETGQIIGIKCGGSWCNVGPDNTWVPLPAKLPPSGALAEIRRTFAIKGYHDQQRLAPPTGRDWDHVSPVTPGDFTKPTDIVGTIVPVPGVGAFTGDMFTGRWSKVATTYLEGAEVGGYREKYGFSRTPTVDVGNEVRLCDPTTGKCPDLPGSIDASESCMKADDTIKLENASGGHSSRWYARVKPADGGGERFLCVIRRSHPEFTGKKMPDTARWRWLLDDDSIWVPCIFSCCHLQGGIG